MKIFFSHSILLIILVGCNLQHSGEKINSPEKIVYTEKMDLQKSNVQLEFNSFGIFDTSYITFRANMCSGPSESYTFSNSTYTCIDSFEVMHRICKEDTMLYMEISEFVFQSDDTIDRDFLKKRKRSITH